MNCATRYCPCHWGPEADAAARFIRVNKAVASWCSWYGSPGRLWKWSKKNGYHDHIYHMSRSCQAMFVNDMICFDCYGSKSWVWDRIDAAWFRFGILPCNLNRYRFVTKYIHKVGEWVYFPSRAPCNEMDVLWRHLKTQPSHGDINVTSSWYFMDLYGAVLPAQMLLWPCTRMTS